jgi:hypothetical protein
MILTIKDRNKFLKAALKSKDPDLAQWLVECVDLLDALPEGQNGAEAPDYRPAPQPAATGAQANGQTSLVPADTLQAVG